MAINFPTSLDTFSNPIGTDLLENATTALDHDVQHSNANDAIEALEAKVGIDGSAVQTSHDYKLSGVATGDKAVSKTGTETLTNKTLTAPQINIGSDATGDMYYRTSGGVFTRLAIGTTGQILNVDASGIPAWIANPSASDASTTVKGVVEIATTAEITAGTGAGGTGALLVVPASAVGSPGASKLVQYTAAGLYPAADGSLITNLANPGVYTNGVFQQNANSTTTTTIAHGLGKAPKLFRISGLGAVTTAHVESHGSYNGTNNRCAYIWHDTNGNLGGSGTDTTAAVWISYASSSGSGATLYIKGVVTWDATNITITWTNGSTGNSSLTISYTWEAFA